MATEPGAKRTKTSEKRRVLIKRMLKASLVAVPDGASFDFDSSISDKNHDPFAPVEEFESHKKIVKEKEVPLQNGMSYG